MARPARNSVDYFPFLCAEGKKMYYLEETYGNDGFAVFVKILRELALSDYHYINLAENRTLMFLSSKCKVSKDVLLSIINDLVDLGKFDDLLWSENSIIWCQDFIDSIQDAYKKRRNKCIDYNSLLQHLHSLGVRKLSLGGNKHSLRVSEGGINPHSIVEYSIEEKTKTKKAENCVGVNNEINVELDCNEFSEIELRLRDYLCDKFKVSELHQFNNYRLINNAIRFYANKSKKEFDWFKNQCQDYFKYKDLAKERKANLNSFLRGESGTFDDGQWNIANWGEKFKECTLKSQIRPTIKLSQPKKVRGYD